MIFFLIFFEKSFQEILLNRHREIQTKTDFNDAIRRLESDVNYARSQTERTLTEKRLIEKELKTIINKQILAEKTYKETLFLYILY